MAANISVAEAAALINVAVIVFTLSFPLLITLVTIGSLKKNVNAATWSVFSRLANQSLWPNILGTDAAGVKKVDKRIKTLSLVATLGAIALAFSAAVTPLGLHTTLRLKEPENTIFTYAPDRSVIGKGTPPRTGYAFDRVCGVYSACPGNYNPWIIKEFSNATGWWVNYSNPTNATISTSIATNITRAFNSATKHSNTVAGVFDIEYRNFANYNEDDDSDMTGLRDHGKPRTQSDFKFFQDFIVDSRVQAVEGIIVSTNDNPGIGFRNHTLPPSSDFGYAWSEDLLWLEPETACTNLNISFDYEIPLPGYSDLYIKGSLVDRGGFVNLDNKWSTIQLHINRTNTQDEPRLLEKSWKTAALTNAITLELLNKTRDHWNRSFVGKQYPLNHILNLGDDPDVDPLWVTFSSYGYWDTPYNTSFSSTWDPGLPPPLDSMQRYTNISNMANMVAHYVGSYVLPSQHDVANIDVIGMGGGLFLAAGSQIDEDGKKMPFSGVSSTSPRSKWSRPIYSCVSAVKASLKTVHFELKGDAILSKLEIKSVVAKHYNSESEWPIWAVEVVPTIPYEHAPERQVSPFWGIVTEETAQSADVMTLRRPSFYLPVSNSLLFDDKMNAIDSAAGANVPLGLLGSIYDGYGIQDAIPELAGSNDWRLLQRISQLSEDATTAGQIINLLWTDLAANALVGTKSVLSRADGNNPQESAPMLARAYENGLAYDWRYAVPALAFAGLYVALLAWSMVLFCTTRLSFSKLRFMLNQSSAGRSMTTERYQASAEADFASTKTWAKTRGGEMVRLTIMDADGKSQDSPSYSLLAPKTESQSSVYIRSRQPSSR